MKKALLLITALITVSIYSFSQKFESRHFTVQKLADGVYAAIAKNGGYAICNAGIIDMGDGVVIIDPFMSPQAAEDLKSAATKLTGKSVKYVVNSHYHNDHIGGNQVFVGAKFITTSTTKSLIEKIHPEEISEHKISAPLQLEKIKNKNTAGMTPHEKEEHLMWKGYYEALVYSVDSLKTILPDLTFDKKTNLSGTKRSLQLLTYGTGHTESDLILYIPKEKIVFTGDLLFIKNHPWLGDGNTEKWKSYLDSIVALHPKILIPGHGPAGSVADIDTMKMYFESIEKIAKNCHDKGVLPENETSLKSLPPFQEWFLSVFFRPNIIRLYNKIYRKQ